MVSSLFNEVEHYANCTVNFFPNADAARSSVIKVIEAFSGSSRRSRAARLVFMRFAISVFDNFLFFQRGRFTQVISKNHPIQGHQSTPAIWIIFYHLSKKPLHQKKCLRRLVTHQVGQDCIWRVIVRLPVQRYGQCQQGTGWGNAPELLHILAPHFKAPIATGGP